MQRSYFAPNTNILITGSRVSLALLPNAKQAKPLKPLFTPQVDVAPSNRLCVGSESI